MKTGKRVGLAILAASIILVSCSKDNAAGGTGGSGVNCTGVATGFATNVLPLIQTKCAINSGCHATGSTNAGGPLTTYSQIRAKAATIKSQVNAGLMPQGGSLTTAEKSTLICWVNAGAPDN